MHRKYRSALLCAAIALPWVAYLPSAEAAQPKPGHTVNSLNQSLTNQGVFGANEAWLSAFVTSFGTPSSNFNYTSPILPAGVYTVSIRAVDRFSQVQQTPRVVIITVT